MDAFCAQVKRIFRDAGLTCANRVLALEAWLLTNLTDSINRRLILRSTCCFTRLIEVKHVARLTLCASLAVSCALGARRVTILTLQLLLIPHLSLPFAQVHTSLSERIQLHVRCALCTGLWSAGTLQTLRVTFDALVADLHTLERDALIDTALMVEEFVGDARGAGRWETFAGEACRGAGLAVVRAGVLDVAIWALSQALSLVQE